MAMHVRIIRIIVLPALLVAGLLVIGSCAVGGFTFIAGSGHVKSEQQVVLKWPTLSRQKNREKYEPLSSFEYVLSRIKEPWSAKE